MEIEVWRSVIGVDESAWEWSKRSARRNDMSVYGSGCRTRGVERE